MSELDLHWEDEERPRHHGRRRASEAQGKKNKKGRGGRTFLAFFLILVVFGGLALGVYVGIDKVKDMFSAPDYNGGGTGEVTVEILQGQLAAQIADTLQQKDVVKSAKAFVEAAKNDDRSRKLQPGFYNLRKQMKATAALTLLLDPKSRLINKVTLPEGLTWQETFKKLEEVTKIPYADFETAAKDPKALGVGDVWYARQDGKPRDPGIEGFLFPATYDFPPNVDAAGILKLIVARFNQEVEKIDFVNTVQSALHISPYEALVASSIAQVEGLDKDQAGIVRVLYNRVYTGKFPCNCLQVDSTVNYYLKITNKGAKPSTELLNSEIHNRNNPYNTHDFPGMPRGPISNPGTSALSAAMNPPKHDFFYFLAIDTQGNTAYAKTYKEFQALWDQAQKNGVK
ncbi:endolytic transglycosylase MltG [Dactylosporangium vinaceum]|uniref:Endolytic murein transglycosylase n=1 Tax=Dactylosporangium vinaceum TaxID=53362 RepID=A0ABV5LZH8_9ACTN|nr:endolytic transglycosylase MltG [Dactylosporangium vinaceum]UAB94655.1 endolytic transglycosylase MltG [Dactylosporangium vinaceum]